MDTIIIFTDWLTITQNQNSYKLSWSPETNGIKVLHINETKILIIAWDGNTTDETTMKETNPKINCILDSIPQSSNVYILHHNKPENEMLHKFIDLIKQKGLILKNKVKKNHLDAEYLKIQKIDESIKDQLKQDKSIKDLNFDNQNKVSIEGIFDWYLDKLDPREKLESNLDLLHKCLYDKPKELFEKPTDEAKDNGDTTALANLRDALIEAAGVIS